MSDQQIQIHMNPDPVKVLEQVPCYRGDHAWGLLTTGGVECRICGVRKR